MRFTFEQFTIYRVLLSKMTSVNDENHITIRSSLSSSSFGTHTTGHHGFNDVHHITIRSSLSGGSIPMFAFGDFSMESKNQPRNCASEVWYIQLTSAMSTITKYSTDPRVATDRYWSRYAKTRRVDVETTLTSNSLRTVLNFFLSLFI